MSDPFLWPFAINMLSAGAFQALSSGFRDYVYGDERSFFKQLKDYLWRATNLNIERSTLTQVVLAPKTWTALLQGHPADSTWAALLYDLGEEARRYGSDEVAEALRVGIRIIGSRDLHLAIANLESLEALKNGQAEIYSELMDLKANLDAHGPSTGSSSESDHVSPSIVTRLAQLRIAIDRLTDEQYGAIRALHGVRRALIPGTAGSGKTLVACEKAIRLDYAGTRTLLLCHNPWLADHLAGMTNGTTVGVASFHEFTRSIQARKLTQNDSWTKETEPSQEDLGEAFDTLAQGAFPTWDAIIVDEGQDFREEWWLLVEAALTGPSSLLYVFVDDDQRLLSARALPDVQQTFPMVRNCRNAGAVYSAMRVLTPGLARVESTIAELGEFHLSFTAPGALVASLPLLSARLEGRQSEDESITLLVSSGLVEPVMERHRSLPLSPELDWRRIVLEALRRLALLPIGVHSLDLRRPAQVEPILAEVSFLEAYWSDGANGPPTEEDILVVNGIARMLEAGTPRPQSSTRNVSRFTIQNGALRLGGAGSWASQVALLASEHWAEGIPTSETMTLVARPPVFSAPGSCGVFEIGDFKGLETDTVIVLWDPVRSSMPLTELYVAVSRAKARAYVLAPENARAVLPTRLIESEY